MFSYREKEQVASLRQELVMKDQSLKRMKDRVKYALDDGHDHTLAFSDSCPKPLGGPCRPRSSFVSNASVSATPIPSTSSVVSLKGELEKKDDGIRQQQDRLEEVGRKLTAMMMDYRDQSSAGIQTLSEKCLRLEVGVSRKGLLKIYCIEVGVALTLSPMQYHHHNNCLHLISSAHYGAVLTY
jgi:hypothetical protein